MIERLAFFFSLAVVVLFLLVSCAPCSCEPHERDAGVTTREHPKPMVPDVEPTEYGEPWTPCARTSVVVIEAGADTLTWSVPLPCRPYNRMTDDPRPAD